MKISIIIPSYNSFETIQYTIDHILKQPHGDDQTEIIVVDSSDDEKTKPYLLTLDQKGIQVVTSGVKR